MSSGALSHDPVRADAITADRAESKYLLAAAVAPKLLAALARELPVHRFTGEGANRLPDPHHFVTSIYFDTPGHDHLRAACRDREHHLKLRAREYYDLHPSLAELATSSSQIVRYQPWVWFELKRRDEGRTTKRRFRLPKRDVPVFLRGELPPPSGEASSAELSEIVAFCRAGEPLEPSCIVNYRRIPFQDAAGALRVTVDAEVGFYRVPSDLWTRTHALVRGTFGAPVARERALLVEVKRSGEVPAWLVRTLAELRAELVPYSKFARAGQAVHGLP